MDNARIYYSHDAEMQAERRNMIIVFFVLGLGIGLGAAAGRLFAPQSGAQTRKDLANSFKESVKTLEDNVEAVFED
jgi:gas vesicle protein